GNLGIPFLDLLNQDPEADYYVLEISSFQAELSKTFHPHLAVFLNLSDDHLDRHPNLLSYRRAKENLFQHMTDSDTLFYNADDLHVLESIAILKTQKIPFSTAKKVKGAWADTEKLAWSPQGEILSTWKQSECSLQGLHNLENMAASIAVTKTLQVSDKIIQEVLKSFKALAHRMSKVAEIEGVAYYNDSKATNVGAAVMSLASFEKNIILIMGGVDKGGSYSPLKALIRAKVKALITMGQAGPKIAQSLEGSTQIFEVNTMEEALQTAHQLAQKGDTVLLAPACSSFDQYANYAKRGEDFERLVFKINKNN
ncbi:MAG: UDP-N-acetylmuramoyl-L-alanine--D-glutamate ligase, partial [Deltaproteobacteria bacterium]|nr:UDP-N-acetylmuramoyl-L-alanine--D-glutamate ligase [Deltaproteobacteria bacterium]